MQLPVAVPAGSALKIERDDGIILAEAVFCRKERNGYFVGVAMEQVLSGLAELGRILQQFQDGPSARQPVNTVDY